jgi:hypothetical protein
VNLEDLPFFSEYRTHLYHSAQCWCVKVLFLLIEREEGEEMMREEREGG